MNARATPRGHARRRSLGRRHKKLIIRSVNDLYRLTRWAGLEPRYPLVVKSYAPAIPQWPQGLTLSIAAIADIHFGEPYMGIGGFQTIVETTNRAKPDLIVLLGDYVATHHGGESHREAAAMVARLAAQMSAPLGVFAIIGNHDWSDDDDTQLRGTGPVVASSALTRAGIRVLENDAIELNHQGGAFWLAGLGDPLAPIAGTFTGHDDLPGTMSKIVNDGPAILLAHEPDMFPHVSNRFSLTLSGHTHGGQIRILGQPIHVPSRYGRRYLHGHKVEEDRHLIVSAGVGISDIPLRAGVSPEIVLVRLGHEISRN